MTDVRITLKTAAPLLIVFACFSSVALAAAPSFDVASIRPSDPAQRVQPIIQTSPGTVSVRNQTLQFCIQWAWDMPPFEVTGPDWLNGSRFDMSAKGGGTEDESQLRLMMRTLLADRFGVKVHSEKKEMQIYLVTLAKGGPKFQESTTEGPPVFTRGRGGSLSAQRVSMKDVAQQLSEPLNRPVVDATGLKGRYDINIDISSYMAAAGGGGKGEGEMDVMSILFTGLQQQLGVKLEAKKDTVDILVVDHAEKLPSEN